MSDGLAEVAVGVAGYIMSVQTSGRYTAIILWAAALTIVAGYMVWDWRQDDLKTTKRAEAAARQNELRCRVVKRALDAIGTRGRADLAETRDGYEPCERVIEEGCAYEVELRFELIAAGREDLSKEAGEILESDCDEGLGFARKHGLAAFRDHQAIIDRMRDEMAPPGPPDIDR